MSSNLRSPSQIGVTTKFLITIGGNQCVTGEFSTGELFGNAGSSIIKIINPSVLLPPVATISELTTILADSDVTQPYCGPPLSAGELFKDMGRQVTVYDDTLPGSPHIATYRECQKVDGFQTEGVPTNEAGYRASLWIRVWAADGTGVFVTRLG
jgi:hypothetical protein